MDEPISNELCLFFFRRRKVLGYQKKEYRSSSINFSPFPELFAVHHWPARHPIVLTSHSYDQKRYINELPFINTKSKLVNIQFVSVPRNDTHSGYTIVIYVTLKYIKQKSLYVCVQEYKAAYNAICTTFRLLFFALGVCVRFNFAQNSIHTYTRYIYRRSRDKMTKNFSFAVRSLRWLLMCENVSICDETKTFVKLLTFCFSLNYNALGE